MRTTVLICSRPLRSGQKDSTSPVENKKKKAFFNQGHSYLTHLFSLYREWFQIFFFFNLRIFVHSLFWETRKTSTHSHPECQRNCWGQLGAPHHWSYPMRRGFPGCVGQWEGTEVTDWPILTGCPHLLPRSIKGRERKRINKHSETGVKTKNH